MKYTYFIFEVFGQEKRSFFENNSLIIVNAESGFVYCFCVNIMIERKQVPEIDFVIASLRQKTFESYLNLSFMLV